MSQKKPDLKEHISSKEKKQTYVNRLFENIAPRYDFITRFLSYGMDKSWKRTLTGLLRLKGNETLLDIACGTGDIAFALAARVPQGRVIGLDITQGMLEIAEQRRRTRGIQNVEFIRGDIMHLPFADAEFNYVTGGYALRNIPDLRSGLREIRRVLKPGGGIYSLDFGHPRSPAFRWLYFKYLIVVGSATGIALHGDADAYRYIPESLKLYPGQRGVKQMMAEEGFLEPGFREFMSGVMAINFGAKG